MTHPATRRDDAVELTLSEERVAARVERVATERVRISKRIVTETKTFTVQVRREELVVEHSPAGGADRPDTDDLVAETGAPVVELVLHEEVPEVALKAVATERILIYKDRLTETNLVDTSLRREEVDVSTPGNATGG